MRASRCNMQKEKAILSQPAVVSVRLKKAVENMQEKTSEQWSTPDRTGVAEKGNDCACFYRQNPRNRSSDNIEVFLPEDKLVEWIQSMEVE